MKLTANGTGRIGEQIVAAVLRSAGIYFDEQYVLGCHSIFKERVRVDFVARNLTQYPHGIILESKYQDRSGSTQQKFCYVYENIKHCYPLPTILVVHGRGFTPGALAWIRQRVDGQHFIGVFTLEDLTTWASRSEKLSRGTAALFTLSR